MNKKVLVAGFFDLLHSGHIRFLEEAAAFGDVYVSLGTDENSIKQKNKSPIFGQEERKYMLESLKYVKEVEISQGETGPQSFVPYLNKLCPDSFITNEDGADLEMKKQLCAEREVEYIELKRTPAFKPRSSSQLREIDRIPNRLDLVGFYDQLMLNSKLPGSVILVNIHPNNFEERSGMSSSTRNVIRKIFGNSLPPHLSPLEAAKIIFGAENLPGQKYISGVVDQLGICLSGITRLKFDNDHWPYKIDSINDPETCGWLQSILYLKQTSPRPPGYNVFDGRETFSHSLIDKQRILGDKCWDAIKEKDSRKLGGVITEVHNNQKQMIPGYESPEVGPIVHNYQRDHYGAKIMGAGGYGYALVVTDTPEKDFLNISLRNGQSGSSYPPLYRDDVRMPH